MTRYKDPLYGACPTPVEVSKSLGAMYSSFNHPAISALLFTTTEELQPGIADVLAKESGVKVLMAGSVGRSYVPNKLMTFDTILDCSFRNLYGEGSSRVRLLAKAIWKS